MKTCTRCLAEKEFTEFYKNRSWHQSMCKKCLKEYNKQNPNKKINDKKYHDKNKEERNKQRKVRSAKDSPERKREINRKWREKKKNDADYQEKNKEKLKNYRLSTKNIPRIQLPRLLRSRLLQAISRQFKKTSVMNLIGCSIDFLISHLESKFLTGMSWDNHGLWKCGEPMKWHIDHIRPCKSFDLTDLEQQKQCFHYTNLQPLWAFDNLSKGDNYEEPKIQEIDNSPII